MTSIYVVILYKNNNGTNPPRATVKNFVNDFESKKGRKKYWEYVKLILIQQYIILCPLHHSEHAFTLKVNKITDNGQNVIPYTSIKYKIHMLNMLPVDIRGWRRDK